MHGNSTGPASTGEPFVVHVLDDYQRVAESCADWHAGPYPLDVRFFHDHVDDEDELVRRHAPADALLLMRERTPVPASLIARLPRLRLIVTTGARNASIDVRAAREAGVVVCGTRALVTPTVELTWALVLAALRGIPEEQASLRAGTWQRSVGHGLAGRRLGIVGLGAIGSRVARVAQAFEMDVVAWSQNLTAEHAAEVGVRAVPREELFETSDVVSIHLRLSDRTRGLVGEPELRAMRDAWLVNTARAEIVDQAALLRALDEGWIAGAALDVFDIEPVPPDHPLLRAPRTLLTPHLGYVVRENYELFYRDAHEALAAYLAGEPVRVIED